VSADSSLNLFWRPIQVPSRGGERGDGSAQKSHRDRLDGVGGIGPALDSTAKGERSCPKGKGRGVLLGGRGSGESGKEERVGLSGTALV